MACAGRRQPQYGLTLKNRLGDLDNALKVWRAMRDVQHQWRIDVGMATNLIRLLAKKDMVYTSDGVML